MLILAELSGENPLHTLEVLLIVIVVVAAVRWWWRRG